MLTESFNGQVAQAEADENEEFGAGSVPSGLGAGTGAAPRAGFALGGLSAGAEVQSDGPRPSAGRFLRVR